MDELIKQLRGCGQCNDDSCKYLDEDNWYCDKDAMMHDSADAIENLIAKVEQSKSANKLP